jgi:hypothetical protein
MGSRQERSGRMSAFLTLMSGRLDNNFTIIAICALHEPGAMDRFSEWLGDWMQRLAPQTSDSIERAE